MKKVLLVLGFILLANTAYAIDIDTSCDGEFGVYVNSCESTNVVGVKLDAPDLVVVSDDLSVGAEVEKNFNGTQTDEGWSFLVKVTGKWTLLDLRKDGE